MKNIILQDDYFKVITINTDLFLYAETQKYNKKHILYIYLANKDTPIKMELQYECFERLQEALQQIYNNQYSRLFRI